MGESNDDVEKTKTKYPELESRHSRGLSYGEESERAKHEKTRKPGDNTAFYLIEREAIELRRLRWELSPERKALSKRVDEIASEMKGKWGAKIGSRTALSPERWLAQYARPFERAEETRSGLLTRTRNAVSRGVSAVGNMLRRFVPKKPETEKKDDGKNQGARE